MSDRVAVDSRHAQFNRKGLYLKVDARDLGAAIALTAAGALAKLGEPDVARLAELKPRRNQDAIDIDAGLPFKFKQHADSAGIVCTAT